MPDASAEPRPADMTARPPARTAGGLDDLSEQLRDTQEQLEQLREQLVHSQRLAALGTVAAVVAHEFNNLLTPVGSYAQYALKTLDDGREDPALIRKALERARNGSRRAESICSSILGLANPDDGADDGSVTELAVVVDEVLNVVGRDLQAGRVRLQVDVADAPPVRADAVHVEQVLLNLIINARQAMAGGGSLSIAAKAGKKGDVRLTVADTGPGIPAETLKRIFEPFYSTKRRATDADTARGGSGLGLSICRQLMERNGGTIAADSTPGRGTRFELRLPRAA